MNIDGGNIYSLSWESKEHILICNIINIVVKKKEIFKGKNIKNYKRKEKGHIYYIALHINKNMHHD